LDSASAANESFDTNLTILVKGKTNQAGEMKLSQKCLLAQSTRGGQVSALDAMI